MALANCGLATSASRNERHLGLGCWPQPYRSPGARAFHAIKFHPALISDSVSATGCTIIGAIR
jgi:hypothetical protein